MIPIAYLLTGLWTAFMFGAGATAVVTRHANEAYLQHLLIVNSDLAPLPMNVCEEIAPQNHDI